MKMFIVTLFGLFLASSASADVFWSWDQSIRVSNELEVENGISAERLQFCGTMENRDLLANQNTNQQNCRSYPDIHPYYFQGSRQEWVDFFDRCQNFDFLNTGVRVAHTLAFLIIFRKAALSRKQLQTITPNRVSRLSQRLSAGRNWVVRNTIDRVIPQQITRLTENGILGGARSAVSSLAGSYTLAEILPDAYPNIVDEAIVDAREMVLNTINGSSMTFPEPRERLLAQEKVIELCSFALKESIVQTEHRACMGSCHGGEATINAVQSVPPQNHIPAPTTLDSRPVDIEELRNYLENVSAVAP